MKTDKALLSAYKKVRKVLGNKGLGKLLIIKSINEKAISKIHSDSITINGHKMFLDPSDSLNLTINEVYEPFETSLLFYEIKNGDIVLDIGAHIGYYTLIMASLVGDRGKVFAFEPEPSNFNLLKKNLESNGYQNIVLENKAVSDKNGYTNLYLCKDNSGMHRIYPSKYCEGQIKVDEIKLDDYFMDSDLKNKISVVKIDVEGTELDVLEGLKEILKNPQIKLFLEFIPDSIKEYHSRPNELLEFLLSQEFSISCINEGEKKIEHFSDISKITELYPEGINLFCKKIIP